MKSFMTHGAISEIYSRFHNILELADVLPNVYFTTSKTTSLLLIKIISTCWLMSCQTT